MGNTRFKFFFFFVILMFSFSSMVGQHRVRDLGINPGILTPGSFNAITYVEGVKVGTVRLLPEIPSERTSPLLYRYSTSALSNLYRAPRRALSPQ